MSDFISLIDKFGIQTGMLALMLAILWWMVKKFICFLEKSNAERKEQTERYNSVLENHIAHSTETQENMVRSIIEFRTEIQNNLKEHTRDHKDIMEATERGHKDIIETIKGI